MKRPKEERTSLGMRIECALIAVLMFLPIASCTVHAIDDLVTKWSLARVLNVIQRLIQ